MVRKDFTSNKKWFSIYVLLNVSELWWSFFVLWNNFNAILCFSVIQESLCKGSRLEKSGVFEDRLKCLVMFLMGIWTTCCHLSKFNQRLWLWIKWMHHQLKTRTRFVTSLHFLRFPELQLWFTFVIHWQIRMKNMSWLLWLWLEVLENVFGLFLLQVNRNNYSNCFQTNLWFEKQ